MSQAQLGLTSDAVKTLITDINRVMAEFTDAFDALGKNQQGRPDRSSRSADGPAALLGLDVLVQIATEASQLPGVYVFDREHMADLMLFGHKSTCLKHCLGSKVLQTCLTKDQPDTRCGPSAREGEVEVYWPDFLRWCAWLHVPWAHAWRGFRAKLPVWWEQTGGHYGFAGGSGY